MFWKRLSSFTRTLSFRLNAWHAVVFLVNAAVIFVLVYLLLGAAIDRKDRDVVEARLREYAAVYKGGGIPALRDWTARVNEARKERMFLVRVVDPKGEVQLVVMPHDWFEADLAKLEHAAGSHPREWIRVPRSHETDLTLASIILDDGTIVQVGRTSDSRGTLLGKFRQVFMIVISPVLLLGFVGGALLTRRLTKPICDVVDAAASIINTGRMDVRVPERVADDELQDLVTLFNRLLTYNEALVRALRDSLDNVAHDLRTPLARLRMSLENSLGGRTLSPVAQDAIVNALEETERVQTIIRTLMDVAQAEAGLLKLEVAESELASLVEDVVGLYDYVAQEKQITIETRIGENLSVEIDAARIRQAFANLLDNAIKYTPPGGQVWIEVRREPGHAVVVFRDNGCGIAEKDLSRMWDRLYRADESRNEPGFGLGLTLVKAIVEAHHGHIDVVSSEGRGSEFRVCLRGPVTSRGERRQPLPNAAVASLES
jgi:signal transduction histidine kinase